MGAIFNMKHEFLPAGLFYIKTGTEACSAYCTIPMTLNPQFLQPCNFYLWEEFLLMSMNFTLQIPFFAILIKKLSQITWAANHKCWNPGIPAHGR